MRMQETILTDTDLAEVLAGRDNYEEETVARLARSVRTDPRTKKQLVRLRRLARDAGLDPEDPESIALACSYVKDFEALIARDDWEEPLEVLDPEVVGTRPAGYEALVRLAEARAERSKNPAPVLAVAEKLKHAQFQLDQCLSHREAFLQSLMSLRGEVAEQLLSEAVFRFQRTRRTERQAEEEEKTMETMGELAEQQFDLLLEAKSRWSHPVQVLPRPRADFEALLRACRLRLASAEGAERLHLEEVQGKLERTVAVAAAARRRREKMRSKKRRGGGGRQRRGTTADPHDILPEPQAPPAGHDW